MIKPLNPVSRGDESPNFRETPYEAMLREIKFPDGGDFSREHILKNLRTPQMFFHSNQTIYCVTLVNGNYILGLLCLCLRCVKKHTVKY